MCPAADPVQILAGVHFYLCSKLCHHNPALRGVSSSFLPPPPYSFSPSYHSPIRKLRDGTPTGEAKMDIVLREQLIYFSHSAFLQSVTRISAVLGTQGDKYLVLMLEELRV